MDEILNNKYLNEAGCTLKLTFTIATNIIKNYFIEDHYMKSIITFYKSKYLSSKRIYKLIINTAYLIANEFNKFTEQHTNISELSIYSILYILFILLCDETYEGRYYKNIFDKISIKYTFIELYNYLCKFNILYTYHFPFKYIILSSFLNFKYIENNVQYAIYVFHTTSYMQTLYLSLKNSSFTFFRKHRIYICEKYFNEYINLLIDHNIQTPFLYFFHFSNFSNNVKYFLNLKNRISRILYYSIVLLYESYTIYCSICCDDLHNYTQSELTNLINERFILNNKNEFFF